MMTGKITNAQLAKKYYNERVADSRYLESAAYRGRGINNLKGAYHYKNIARFHPYQVAAEHIKNLKIDLYALYIQRRNLYPLERNGLSHLVVNDLERILEEKTGLETMRGIKKKAKSKTFAPTPIILLRRLRQ